MAASTTAMPQSVSGDAVTAVIIGPQSYVKTPRYRSVTPYTMTIESPAGPQNILNVFRDLPQL